MKEPCIRGNIPAIIFHAQEDTPRRCITRTYWCITFFRIVLLYLVWDTLAWYSAIILFCSGPPWWHPQTLNFWTAAIRNGEKRCQFQAFDRYGIERHVIKDTFNIHGYTQIGKFLSDLCWKSYTESGSSGPTHLCVKIHAENRFCQKR